MRKIETRLLPDLLLLSFAVGLVVYLLLVKNERFFEQAGWLALACGAACFGVLVTTFGRGAAGWRKNVISDFAKIAGGFTFALLALAFWLESGKLTGAAVLLFFGLVASRSVLARRLTNRSSGPA